jgi:hypothetical protein
LLLLFLLSLLLVVAMGRNKDMADDGFGNSGGGGILFPKISDAERERERERELDARKMS